MPQREAPTTKRKVVKQPAPAEHWHPIAMSWYKSLAASGQAQFYEPSDWMMAYTLAEQIHHEFSEKVISVTPTGEKIWGYAPMSGASLNAVLKGMSNLLVSEGDRRRRSEEHTSELQSRENLVCRLLLE